MKRTIPGLLAALSVLTLAPRVAAAESGPGNPWRRPAAGSVVTPDGAGLIPGSPSAWISTESMSAISSITATVSVIRMPA
jgi:hypothetical protein